MSRNELVGREQEADRLRQALRSAARGSGGVVLVAGEAGIGKTALVETLVVRGSHIVLRGAARLDATPPLGPLLAAVRSHPGWPAVVDEALDRAGRGALRTILPEVGPDQPPTTPIVSEPAAGSPDELTTLGRLIIGLARVAPLTIVLDDLQWVDHATVEALSLLARLVERERILVVGVYRSDELSRANPLRRLRSGLRRVGRPAEIVLEPLEAAGILELATRRLGAPPDEILGPRLVERSQGVPLYVEELALALVNEGAVSIADGVARLVREDLPIPDTLRDSVLVRAENLAPRTREALGVAALIGNGFTVSIVEELVPNAGDWPRAGTDAGILAASTEDRIAFRHALIREVLAHDLPAPERRAYQRRLAQLLAERDSDPLEVAEHWLEADEAGVAVTWLMKAGDASCRIHAFRDAAAAFRRALDEDRGTLPDRVTVLERLAESSELAGATVEAARSWGTAAAARFELGDDLAAAQDERRRARALEVQGRWKRAVEARLEAARGFAAGGALAEAALERLVAAAHLRSAASFGAALEIVAIARTDAVAAGRPGPRGPGDGPRGQRPRPHGPG